MQGKLSEKFLLDKFKTNKLHIGCGNIRLANHVNIDIQKTPATDITCDCRCLSNYFLDNTFEHILSNAWFEHIWLFEQESCLKSIHKVLKENGFLYLIGLPDFEVIVDYYRKGKKVPGPYSLNKNLGNVMRYTHGLTPKHINDKNNFQIICQLHKSLIDKSMMEYMLKNSGFKKYIIFNYCFPKEELPLNMGVLAMKNDNEKTFKESWKKAKELSKEIVDLETIKKWKRKK